MKFLPQQIDDTVGVMRENINKVSQRGERLDSLQDKTDNLAVSAQGFRRGANRVRKQVSKVSIRALFWLYLTNAMGLLDVVEGHEDANVPHCWYHHPINCHHCPGW